MGSALGAHRLLFLLLRLDRERFFLDGGAKSLESNGTGKKPVSGHLGEVFQFVVVQLW